MPANAPDAQIQFTFPLIFDFANFIFGKPGTVLGDLILHPIGIAAWVGMFATALNLLPGGQLDGGHIVFALWPRWHRWISRIAVIALVMGTFFWVGWGVWAVLLTFSGMKHPPLGSPFPQMFADEPWESPYAPLPRSRIWLALFAAAMLVVTFMPAPFLGGGLGR